MDLTRFNELSGQLTQAKADYHAAADAETAPQLAARSARIKEIMWAIDAGVIEGANKCPTCGEEPYGRLRTPQYTNKGRIVPAVFEIRCRSPQCADKAATGLRDPRAAVFAWNEGITEKD